MAVADLTNEKQEIITGNDNVVIVDVFASVRGGRTLDVTDYPKDVLNAGHVIIQETESKEYKPMPLNSEGDAYAALPSGHTYGGVLIASIRKKRPFAGILTRGTVNPAAAPFPMDAILSAVKTALPLIDFRED